MALRDRTIKFRNVSIASLAKYVSFSEEMPEPKVFTVDIPAGKDLDITDSLGVVGYHNGKHTLKFLIYGATEERRLEIKRTLVTLFHGRRGDYFLSWEPTRRYVGRAKVSFEHLFDNADVMTLEISREPYSTQYDPDTGQDARERIDVNLKTSSSNTVSYALEGSARYHRVYVINTQPIVVYTEETGTLTLDDSDAHKIADDFYGRTVLTLRGNKDGVSGKDWWYYFSGTNVVANSEHFTVSGTNVTSDSNYTITNGDIHYNDESKQHVTLVLTRMDL